MRLALVVEYEGTNYHGFQYQANAPSIQGEIERAIGRTTGETVRIKAAGRTDAGVHAKGQVIAFDTQSSLSAETFLGALNFHLPSDIAVVLACRVREGFDPRRDAVKRRYRYTILNRTAPSPLMRRTVCHIPGLLDAGAMSEAVGLLIGEHDFANFSGPLEDSAASTVRRIYEAWMSESGEVISFDVAGNSFLPRQVRRMAGALLKIGKHELSMKDLEQLIDGETRDGAMSSLPPHGLCLVEVTYTDFPPKDGELDGG